MGFSRSAAGEGETPVADIGKVAQGLEANCRGGFLAAEISRAGRQTDIGLDLPAVTKVRGAWRVGTERGSGDEEEGEEAGQGGRVGENKRRAKNEKRKKGAVLAVLAG